MQPLAWPCASLKVQGTHSRLPLPGRESTVATGPAAQRVVPRMSTPLLLETPRKLLLPAYPVHPGFQVIAEQNKDTPCHVFDRAQWLTAT